MMTDSMIRYVHPVTRDIDERHARIFQRKLVWIPKIGAGLSYWGNIGIIAKDIIAWIERRISSNDYKDLTSFAASFERALNDRWTKVRHHPDDAIGFHLAGFEKWGDGVKRPAFFHIHNGHLSHDAWPASGETGPLRLHFPTGLEMDRCANSKELKARATEFFKLWRTSAIAWKAKADSRGPFKAHRDFPDARRSTLENETTLNGAGYLTHNGDYMRFALVSFEGTLEKGLYEWPRLGGLPDGIERDVLLLESLLRRSLQIEPGPRGETIGGKTWSLGIVSPGKFVDTMRR